jgi:hypothetical protein
MPLALAVTAALAVYPSCARISSASIGLIVSRERLSDTKISRSRTALASGSEVLAGRLLRMVIGKTTPSRAKVLTLGLLRISSLVSSRSSSTACCGARNAIRRLLRFRQAPLAARATAACPAASTLSGSTSRSAYTRWLLANRRRLPSWPAVSSAARAAAV